MPPRDLGLPGKSPWGRGGLHLSPCWRGGGGGSLLSNKAAGRVQPCLCGLGCQRRVPFPTCCAERPLQGPAMKCTGGCGECLGSPPPGRKWGSHRGWRGRPASSPSPLRPGARKEMQHSWRCPSSAGTMEARGGRRSRDLETREWLQCARLLQWDNPATCGTCPLRHSTQSGTSATAHDCRDCKAAAQPGCATHSHACHYCPGLAHPGFCVEHAQCPPGTTVSALGGARPGEVTLQGRASTPGLPTSFPTLAGHTQQEHAVTASSTPPPDTCASAALHFHWAPGSQVTPWGWWAWRGGPAAGCCLGPVDSYGCP